MPNHRIRRFAMLGAAAATLALPASVGAASRSRQRCNLLIDPPWRVANWAAGAAVCNGAFVEVALQEWNGFWQTESITGMGWDSNRTRARCFKGWGIGRYAKAWRTVVWTNDNQYGTKADTIRCDR